MLTKTSLRTLVAGLLVVSLPLQAAAFQTSDADGQPTAASLRAPAPRLDLSAATMPAPQTVSDWQRQIDEARARRSSGRKLHYGGVAVALAGLVYNSVALSSAETCHRGSCPGPSSALVGLGMMVSGTVMGIAGSVKAHDADGEVNALIARGPGRAAAVSMPVGDHGNMNLGLGRTVGFRYRITW